MTVYAKLPYMKEERNVIVLASLAPKLTIIFAICTFNSLSWHNVSTNLHLKIGQSLFKCHCCRYINGPATVNGQAIDSTLFIYLFIYFIDTYPLQYFLFSL